MVYPATQTTLTPSLSERMPHIGHAKSATNSSTKPNVPTRSPTPSLIPIRSVITKDTLLFRKTRKDIENKHTASRYAQAWVAVVDDANGRYLDTENIFGLPSVSLAILVVSIDAQEHFCCVTKRLGRGEGEEEDHVPYQVQGVVSPRNLEIKDSMPLPPHLQAIRSRLRGALGNITVLYTNYLLAV